MVMVQREKDIRRKINFKIEIKHSLHLGTFPSDVASGVRKEIQGISMIVLSKQWK